ncbi:type II secretion system minor pseudopilin GspI [Sphingomonas gellani]|nr:type II secretion system minor pseudopilin GspI [Sphingomonas gellani]
MDDRSDPNGFTLIEIMVALVVFSLAVLALLRLESGTIRGVSIIDDTAAANLVAHNVAEDAVTSARPPALGAQTGREVNGGRGWAWTRTVSPTGNARVLRVDVAVSDARGRVVARATLVRPPYVGVVT